MALIYLSLGSNLGNRLQNLKHAVNELKTQISISKFSRIYETEPWGVHNQDKFLNFCLQGITKFEPLEILSFLKEVETVVGRKDTFRWGPREIDIDLLFYDSIILKTDKLTIPHQGIPERAFVLIPLLELAPDFIHPTEQMTIRDLTKTVQGSEGLIKYIHQPFQ